ncbi:hypothetical protein AC1031_018147 [Aphanomyces cochlioides]|nr:hypothetical protein AC1031_018147 [Aphanomyces cochlioides]
MEGTSEERPTAVAGPSSSETSEERMHRRMDALERQMESLPDRICRAIAQQTAQRNTVVDETLYLIRQRLQALETQVDRLSFSVARAVDGRLPNSPTLSANAPPPLAASQELTFAMRTLTTAIMQTTSRTPVTELSGSSLLERPAKRVRVDSDIPQETSSAPNQAIEHTAPTQNALLSNQSFQISEESENNLPIKTLPANVPAASSSNEDTPSVEASNLQFVNATGNILTQTTSTNGSVNSPDKHYVASLRMPQRRASNVSDNDTISSPLPGESEDEAFATRVSSISKSTTGAKTPVMQHTQKTEKGEDVPQANSVAAPSNEENEVVKPPRKKPGRKPGWSKKAKASEIMHDEGHESYEVTDEADTPKPARKKPGRKPGSGKKSQTLAEPPKDELGESTDEEAIIKPPRKKPGRKPGWRKQIQITEEVLEDNQESSNESSDDTEAKKPPRKKPGRKPGSGKKSRPSVDLTEDELEPNDITSKGGERTPRWKKSLEIDMSVPGDSSKELVGANVEVPTPPVNEISPTTEEPVKKRRGPKPGWKKAKMLEEAERNILENLSRSTTLKSDVVSDGAPQPKKRGRPKSLSSPKPRGRPKRVNHSEVVSPLTTAWDEVRSPTNIETQNDNDEDNPENGSFYQESSSPTKKPRVAKFHDESPQILPKEPGLEVSPDMFEDILGPAIGEIVSPFVESVKLVKPVDPIESLPHSTDQTRRATEKDLSSEATVLLSVEGIGSPAPPAKKKRGRPKGYKVGQKNVETAEDTKTANEEKGANKTAELPTSATMHLGKKNQLTADAQRQIPDEVPSEMSEAEWQPTEMNKKSSKSKDTTSKLADAIRNDKVDENDDPETPRTTAGDALVTLAASARVSSNEPSGSRETTITNRTSGSSNSGSSILTVEKSSITVSVVGQSTESSPVDVNTHNHPERKNADVELSGSSIVISEPTDISESKRNDSQSKPAPETAKSPTALSRLVNFSSESSSKSLPVEKSPQEIFVPPTNFSSSQSSLVSAPSKPKRTRWDPVQPGNKTSSSSRQPEGEEFVEKPVVANRHGAQELQIVTGNLNNSDQTVASASSETSNREAEIADAQAKKKPSRWTPTSRKGSGTPEESMSELSTSSKSGNSTTGSSKSSTQVAEHSSLTRSEKSDEQSGKRPSVENTSYLLPPRLTNKITTKVASDDISRPTTTPGPGNESDQMVVPKSPASSAETIGATFEWKDGQLHRVPENWKCPASTCKTMWCYWFRGDTVNQIGPFRFLRSHDVNDSNSRILLARGRAVMDQLIKIATNNLLAGSVEHISEMPSAELLAVFDKSFDILLGKTPDGALTREGFEKLRLEQVVYYMYGSVYEIMAKEKKKKRAFDV